MCKLRADCHVTIWNVSFAQGFGATGTIKAIKWESGSNTNLVLSERADRASQWLSDLDFIKFSIAWVLIGMIGPNPYKQKRVWLSCSHLCFRQDQIVWLFIWEVTLSLFAYTSFLSIPCYKSISFYLPKKKSYDLNWVARKLFSWVCLSICSS